MQYFQIPTTETKLSRIALGSGSMGGGYNRNPITSEVMQTANKAIDAALESGINFFDHADIYSFYKSDEVFGRILQDRKELRSHVVIQTKCGIRPSWEVEGQSRFGTFDFSEAHILASVEGSLKRLHTDCLDFLLLHRPDPLCDPEEVDRAFNKLLRDGKVKHFGVSNHTAMQIEVLRKNLTVPLVFNQLRFNILFSSMLNSGTDFHANQPGDPLSATMTFDYCKLHGIIVQAYGPQQHGFLSDRILGNEKPESDFSSQILEIQKVVQRIAKDHDCPPDAIPLAWLMRLPHTVQPILGNLNPKRIRESCKASDIHLSREEWYELYAAGRGAPLA